MPATKTHPARIIHEYGMCWIEKRSHTQKSHPKVVNPRDIARERKKKKKTKKQQQQQQQKTQTKQNKQTNKQKTNYKTMTRCFRGRVADACSVCGGDGTTCLATAAVIPNMVPSDINKVSVLRFISVHFILFCLFILLIYLSICYRPR